MSENDDLSVYAEVRRDLRVARERMACLNRYLGNATKDVTRMARCLLHYRKHGWSQWPGSNLMAVSTDPRMPKGTVPSNEKLVEALDEYRTLLVETIPNLEREMAQIEDALNAKGDEGDEGDEIAQGD